MTLPKHLKTPPIRMGFSKVKEAREALKARAEKWVTMYDQAVEKAIKTGELDVAIRAIQWAQEHMPSDDGVTVLDVSVDKGRQETGPSGPQINIGFALGGLTPKGSLPPAPTIQVIDLQAIDLEGPSDDESETLPSGRSPVEQPGGIQVQSDLADGSGGDSLRPSPEAARISQADGT